MRESTQQLQILAWLKAHQTHDPTLSEALLAEWPKLVLPIGSVAAGWVLATSGSNVTVGYFLVGLGVGILGTHVGSIVVRLRAFRAYRAVTDWNKVEDALNGKDVAI